MACGDTRHDILILTTSKTGFAAGRRPRDAPPPRGRSTLNFHILLLVWLIFLGMGTMGAAWRKYWNWPSILVKNIIKNIIQHPERIPYVQIQCGTNFFILDSIRTRL